MSIRIQEARQKLDILEKIPENPQLIFTDLFSQNKSDYADDYRFLHEVELQGMDYIEHIPKYLQPLPSFKNTTIGVWGTELRIYIPSLKHGEYQHAQPDDIILEIDLHKKTYHLNDQAIKDHLSVLEKEYTLETCELSDFWKKFEDFTFKKRLKGAFSVLTSDKKLHIRIFDFLYLLMIRRKTVDTALAKERERINEKNERSLYFYNNRIALQNFYKEHLPAQIERIREKQGEIVEYLRELGYMDQAKEEDDKMDVGGAKMDEKNV